LLLALAGGAGLLWWGRSAFAADSVTPDPGARQLTGADPIVSSNLLPSVVTASASGPTNAPALLTEALAGPAPIDFSIFTAEQLARIAKNPKAFSERRLRQIEEDRRKAIAAEAALRARTTSHPPRVEPQQQPPLAVVAPRAIPANQTPVTDQAKPAPPAPAPAATHGHRGKPLTKSPPPRPARP
jgi:hypothetical protein